MARIHTMEDDITFERVRHLPRRTRVCSVHRQLSWACHKEIELYEKDTRVTTNNIDRSKTALQGRFRELINVKKKLRDKKIEQINRRASCPAALPSGAKTQCPVQDMSELPIKLRKFDDNENMTKAVCADTGNVVKTDIIQDMKTSPMKRAVSIMDRVNYRSGNEAYVNKAKSSASANGIKRQQSMPAL